MKDSRYIAANLKNERPALTLAEMQDMNEPPTKAKGGICEIYRIPKQTPKHAGMLKFLSGLLKSQRQKSMTGIHRRKMENNLK